LFVFLGVNSKNLFLPWVYGGDGLGTYQVVQNIKDSGWASSNPRLAAPFSTQNSDYMASFTDNIAILFLKFFLSISNNIWFSVNINYILNCIAISLISYFVMVNLKINRIIASAGSLTFSLLPYFFLRGINHYFLSLKILSFFLCRYDTGSAILPSVNKIPNLRRL
jgi:phosphoglycerol transferase